MQQKRSRVGQDAGKYAYNMILQGKGEQVVKDVIPYLAQQYGYFLK